MIDLPKIPLPSRDADWQEWLGWFLMIACLGALAFLALMLVPFAIIVGLPFFCFGYLIWLVITWWIDDGSQDTNG